MVTCETEQNRIVASLPYPSVGASQYLTIVHYDKSERPSDDTLFLSEENIKDTVLAGAFFPDVEVVLPTPLAYPYNELVLPPLPRHLLREEIVRDEEGKILGMMYRVPGLFVRANRLLQNLINNNINYDYRDEIINMVWESGKLLASFINRGVVNVRDTPGVMAHALELRELAADEIGISVQFAEKVLEKLQTYMPLQFGSVWDLDGFPVHAIRFPVANRYGVQAMVLRILQGVGRYIACSPFNLGKLWLGDRDGDMLFAALRWLDVENGLVAIEKRPPVEVNKLIRRASACVTLQSLADPQRIECEEKLQKKMETPDLSTRELRLQYIKDADTRTNVAIYTLIFGWHFPRCLLTSGRYDPQTAYQMGNDVLEWFTEAVMDARKGGSAMSDPRFDSHRFMRLLMQGRSRNEDMDFNMLLQIGVPPHLVEIIREVWQITDGQITAYVSRSPIYRALVVKRKSTETSIPQMLMQLQDTGVKPEATYNRIVADLTGKGPLLCL